MAVLNTMVAPLLLAIVALVCALASAAPLAVKHVTYRIADVDVSPPESWNPLFHEPPSSYEVLLVDVIFDQPVFYRGAPLPDLEEFIATAHDNHRVFGDVFRLACNASATSPAITLSSDPRSPAHTGAPLQYLVPLAAAPASKFPWLRALAGLAAHGAPGALPAAAMRSQPGLHTRGPVNWSRVTLATLLTSWHPDNAPASPAAAAVVSLPRHAFSPAPASSSAARSLRVSALRRSALSIELLTAGRCTLVLPAPASPARGLTSRAAPLVPVAGTWALRGGLAAQRRRLILASSSTRAEELEAVSAAATGSVFMEADSSSGALARSGLSLMSSTAVGIPFLSTLLAPITSFIQENTVRRAPEFMKFRIKTDFTKRAAQSAISTELYGGSDGNDAAAEPIAALMELRTRATAEFAGEEFKYSRTRPQKTSTGKFLSIAQYLASPESLHDDFSPLFEAAAALREGVRNDFGSLLEMQQHARATAKAKLRARAKAGFPAEDADVAPAPPMDLLQNWVEPGQPDEPEKKGDRTQMTPDGCVALSLTATIIHTVTNLVTIGVIQSLVANTQHSIAAEISPSQIETVVPELIEALPRAVIPMVTAALQVSVPAAVKRLVPPLVVKHSAAALTDTLTRGLVHVLAPTLSHTLRDAGRVEPVCYYCHHVDPRYCYLCPRDRPVPQSVQGHLDLHTVDFMADYYSDYYADYYNGRQPLASAYQRYIFHQGGPLTPVG